MGGVIMACKGPNDTITLHVTTIVLFGNRFYSSQSFFGHFPNKPSASSVCEPWANRRPGGHDPSAGGHRPPGWPGGQIVRGSWYCSSDTFFDLSSGKLLSGSNLFSSYLAVRDLESTRSLKCPICPIVITWGLGEGEIMVIVSRRGFFSTSEDQILLWKSNMRG